MKKISQICYITGFAILAYSCTEQKLEQTSDKIQTVEVVKKSAKMLEFETNLQDWLINQNKSDIQKTSNPKILKTAKELLLELKVDDNLIVEKTNVSEKELVMFTLTEYSKYLKITFNKKNNLP